jgi:lipopolysaccharide transport system ATP-binding protein
MKPIIRVENLSKQYRIGAAQAPYKTLRESLTEAVRAPFSRFRSNGNGADNTVWALKDVSFEVMPGEIVGIIGRNGAGKSTLLKILSRITEPTEGKVDLYGRVGSLLEVGTGFHPELTGRENIYLNGAILGMKHNEVARKFDEIVSFAEIERFIDTPVKHYSSGMYTRLAFAVAAHLESEILFIDEVLAVGDQNFQKKCFGKMEDLGSQGRTVIFVSHSMPMILRLCQRVIMLSKGRNTNDGEPQKIIRCYLGSNVDSSGEKVWVESGTEPGDELVRIKAVRALNNLNEIREIFDVKEEVIIEIEYLMLKDKGCPTISMHIINEDGVTLFCTNDWNNRRWWKSPRKRGLIVAKCYLPANLLAEGRVYVLVAICSYNPTKHHLVERDVISFQLVDKSEGQAVRGEYAGEWPGVMRPMLNWRIESRTETGGVITYE